MSNEQLFLNNNFKPKNFGPTVIYHRGVAGISKGRNGRYFIVSSNTGENFANKMRAKISRNGYKSAEAAIKVFNEAFPQPMMTIHHDGVRTVMFHTDGAEARIESFLYDND